VAMPCPWTLRWKPVGTPREAWCCVSEGELLAARHASLAMLEYNDGRERARRGTRLRQAASLICCHDLSSEIRKPNHRRGRSRKGVREVCVRETRQRMTNRTDPFLPPLVAVTLLPVRCHFELDSMTIAAPGPWELTWNLGAP
jgi:hypothetical protein